MIKGIVFDFDGTITEGLIHHDQAYLAVLKSLGIQIPLNELRQHVGKTVLQVYQAVLADKNYDLDFLNNLNKIHDDKVYELYIAHAEPAPYVLRFIEQVAEMKLKVSVASSTHTRILIDCLKKFGVFHHFQAIVGGDQITKGKPNPEMIEKALEKIELAGYEALAIDDLPRGIEAAKVLNLKTIMYTFYSKEHDLSADWSFNSYEEINLQKILL